MIRTATSEEIKNWNALVLGNPDGGHIYQSYEWGEYKSNYGWEPVRLVFEHKESRVAVQLIKKKVIGVGNFYYCPKGPGIFPRYTPDDASKDRFREWTIEVKKWIAKNDKSAIELMIEPEVVEGTDIKSFGYVKDRHDLQFKATIIVPIGMPDKELLDSFKSKTRYNVRLSERHGVKVEKRNPTSEMIDLMYGLMQATQERAHFFMRPKSAFGRYWKMLADAGLGQFLVATHEGEVIAAEFAFIFGTKAYYKDGGSYAKKRNIMAPYLLQYESMRWARDNGATEYDMVAVPKLADINPEHRLFGLYQFKSGFHHEVTEFVGNWDLVINEKRSKLWHKIESLYTKIYGRVKRNLFY